MPTYNTTTGTFGHVADVDNMPIAPRSEEDKSIRAVEFTSAGMEIARKSNTPQSIDIRANEIAEIKASAAGPSSAPIRLRKRNGAAGTAAQAEANPSRYMISILGRETSLQAAIATGWVTRGADGNYYDSRVTPGK